MNYVPVIFRPENGLPVAGIVLRLGTVLRKGIIFCIRESWEKAAVGGTKK